MRITRPLKLTAAAALTSVAASIVVAGPLAASALAAPGKPQPTPMPSLTTHPTNPTASTTANFAWTAPVAETYTCTLDGAKSNACTSPVSYSGLANGTHSFTLRAKLPAPAKSRASTVTFSWVVDTTPPAAPSVTQVTSPTSNTGANVFFTGDSSSTGFTCAVDNPNPAVATTCTSPYTVSGLTEGSHTAYVYAFDALLNRSTAGTTTWTVDLSAPGSPVFTQVPTNPTKATSATFAWTDGDATAFLCSLDGAAPVTCSSGVTFPNLAEGAHTLTVQGRDAAGNVGLPATFGWTIDRTAPVAPVFVTGPASPTDQTTANFVFTDAEQGVNFLCSLDGAGYTACQSPLSTTAYLATLADGDHELDVEAADSLGNTSIPTAYHWNVDTTGTLVPLSPVVFIDGPDAFSNVSHPTFDWSALDSTATGFECSLDLAPFTACGSPDSSGFGSTSVTVSGDGLHTLAVRETDGVNNSSATLWSWHYDSTAPTQPSFSTTPGAIDPSANALFSFASDPDAHFTCSLDGATAGFCASPVTLQGLADGAHTFVVTAIDPAGNTSSNEFDWTIDTSAPQPPVVTGPTGLVKVDTADISWSESDSSVTSVTCLLDGDDYSTCTNSVSLDSLSEGDHTFTVVASDGTRSSQRSVTWTVDTTPPGLDVSGVPSGLTNQTSVTPVISQGGELHPGANVCVLTGPDGAVNNCGPYTLGDGDYSLTVDTTDAAGNAATQESRSWTVDATAPEIDVTGLPDAGAIVPSTSFSPSVTDADLHSSGTYTCALTGPVTSTDCSTLEDLTDGSYTFTADTTDAAGNDAVEYSRTWVVDATAPQLSVTGLPANGAHVKTTDFDVAVDVSDDNPSGSVDCTLNGDPSSCTTLSLTDGPYTFTADTSDLAGNVAQQVTRSFTVDTHAPAKPAVTGTSGTVNTTAASFDLSDTDGDVASYECSLNGAAATPCPANGYSPTGVEGTNTLDVVAVDQAGNKSAARTVTWIVDTAAPTATVRAPRTLTGAAVATWSEPVSGLDASKVTLKETDSGKVISSTVTSTATTVTVTPKTRLVPGQHYTVSFADGAAQDAAANGTLAASSNFRAQRTLQETTAPVKVTWRSVKARPAYGHRYASEHLAGSQATWAFRGRAITWWTVTGPTQGKARVYVDGKRKATVNNYATATHYRVARTFKKLGTGRHVLTIRVLGVKGAKLGKGTAVAVDGFTVGKKRTASPRLTTSWHRVTGSAFYNRHAVVADLAGEAISLTFRGTSIAWTTVRNKTQGKAAVYVDGVRKATVDNYSKLSLNKVRRVVRGLSDSVHTVRIVVLGKHHKGGKGNNVTVDRFVIG